MFSCNLVSYSFDMKYWYKHEFPALHNMTLLFWGEIQFSIGNGGQHAWFMKYWDIQLYSWKVVAIFWLCKFPYEEELCIKL